jgi:hypothetical protein
LLFVFPDAEHVQSRCVLELIDQRDRGSMSEAPPDERPRLAANPIRCRERLSGMEGEESGCQNVMLIGLDRQ